MNKPILFFDGGCPLCRKEISHYQKLDTERAVDWVDITQSSERLDAFGLSYAQAMQYIHGVNRQGELVRGVAAFVLVWRELPYYRGLARLINATGLQRPLDFAYTHFARWRFKRRCKSGQCSV